ncbi:ABC transporter permease [Thioclava marina]|uniref:ABC transporter permease n=1 Tax=Thioclava marina TaxID=1915077 RepID=A0ABX3MKN3_9RHOB|nr:ABC transporter permease [Thioclava marina]OOY11927.1 ABC transporter permease [Thioclava marina]
MLTYTLRTLVRMALTFFVIVTLVFFATRLSGNAIDFLAGEGMTQRDREILIRYYELDRSIWDQYLAFLRAFLDGNFGLSFIERRPVIQIVVERLWPSAQLLLSAIGLTLVVALPLGVIAAIWRKHWLGSAAMVVAFLGYAVPNFILAVVMVLVFAYWLNWLPVVGNGTPLHFIMPTLAMSGVLIAALTRFTRNAMLDVLGQDFMRTARAKGLPERAVILRHGLRNASITLLSVIGLQIAGLAASGSVVVESIFAWPGIGDLLVSSAIRRDYPVLQFGVITVAIAVIVINAAIDLAYAWADPRLRHQLKG